MSKIHLSAEDLACCSLAKSILEKNYAQNYTIDHLARKVGINQDKLKKGFKSAYEITIHAYVTSLRVEKAKELLESTEVPIEHIACKLGLDHSNLTKQFKRHTGCTPKAWRQNKKGRDRGYAA
jgi:AraC-like DNA-binding protein